MPGYQKRHHTIFVTVRSEGAILPMDLLQRIAQGDPNLQGLTPESYNLLKTEKLNEAINRSWNRLLSAWVAFKVARDKLPERDTGTTLTRERWWPRAQNHGQLLYTHQADYLPARLRA